MAAALLDFTSAVVVAPADLRPRERKAIDLLIGEVERRTRIRWPLAHAWPSEPSAVVAVGLAADVDAFAGSFAAALAAEPAPDGAEGYRIRVDGDESGAPAVLLTGNDSRGVLFAVGRLLRELRMSRDSITLPDDLRVATAPHYPLRGHQLGYRPKTNAYDAWSVPMWEQYVRDLAVFGANTIELIPPRSDDDDDSPQFPLPKIEMMVAMSEIADSYGLDVWIWFPAMDEDYADPATVEFALDEWAEVFRRLPRIDALFVPGGDPGHTRPTALMDLLEKQTELLRRHHPDAQMWMSPQSFGAAWVDEFYDYVRNRRPAWLSGVVFGPQCRMSLPELRAALPKHLPIRRYPDITHTIRCQYPVPDWDLAYALTEDREVINPRPLDQARNIRLWVRDSIGFSTYSEGCNDDLNKAVWSSLGWDLDTDVVEVLRQYARYFIAPRWADEFAQGLLALERNWQGPLLTNAAVTTTLRQFLALERAATPQDLLNWRFQQALYRAYYDAHLRRRLISETELEARALDELRRAEQMGSRLALKRAERALDRAVTDPVGGAWRARVFELAEALFQSIRMQLSVPRYQAIHAGRGANLDLIDRPLNNRAWLREQFAEVRAIGDESQRLARIAEIVNWTDPGPGGFYDDLGNPARQPHLVRGPEQAVDPEFRVRSLVGFAYEPGWRLSWCRHAESRYDAPLRLRYEGLDPAGRYRVRAVYAGDRFDAQVQLSANGDMEIHPFISKPHPLRPLEFEIPPEATAGGELSLTWTQEPGQGGAGRGCQVAEVWLIKVAPQSPGGSAGRLIAGTLPGRHPSRRQGGRRIGSDRPLSLTGRGPGGSDGPSP